MKYHSLPRLGRDRAAFSFALAIALSLLVLAPAIAQSPAAEDSSAPVIRWEPYIFVSSHGDSIDAELGHLRVPEYRANPLSRTILLTLVRLPATASRSGHPLVYLDGGPGNSGISSSRRDRFPMFQALRAVGDVIVFDHRGVGLSEPDMSCVGTFDLSLEKPLDQKEFIEAARRVSRQCAAAVRSKGVDLRGYTVKEAADDVDDIRRALGVDKINILGLSYGTTHALTVLRRHSSHINRAILAGTEGPDDAVKLPSRVDSMFYAADALWSRDTLSRQMPSMVSVYRDGVAKLRAHPVSVRVLPFGSKRQQDSVTVTIGALDLESITYALLGGDGLPYLPSLLNSVRNGDYRLVAALAASDRKDGFDALSNSVDCSTGASNQRLRRVAQETPASLLGRAANLFFYPQLCIAWGVPDVGPQYREAVHTEVPTLFISGGMDARTPPLQAELVRHTFSHSSHQIIDGAVHSTPLFLSAPEMLPTMLRFLRGETIADGHVKGSFHFLPITTAFPE